MDKISIVITNYNHRDCLELCISSLYAQTYKNFEVIFIDNGSIDNSAAFIKNNFPEIRLMEIASDQGEAVATNIGIKHARNNYIVLLNADIRLHERFLEELLNIVTMDKSIGISVPKILNFFYPQKIDSVGHGLYYDFFPLHIGQDEEDIGQYETAGEVFGFCLAGAMLRKEVFETAGLFDEDLFYHSCDDFSWRARKAGYKCMYAPQAIMWHKRLKSSVTNTMAVFFWEKNRIIAILKYYPFNMLAASFYYTFKRLSISFMSHSFFNKREKQARISILRTLVTIFSAWCSVAIQLPWIIKKRLIYFKKIKNTADANINVFLKRSWRSI